MNGELAQVIALATHGTAWLRDPREPAPALNQTSSTFKFVRSLEFVIDDRKGLLRRTQHAATRDVASWLDRLRRQGTTRLWLVIPTPEAQTLDGYTTDAHMLIAFAGAGTWLLLATGDKRAEIWGPKWHVGAQGASDNRIWDVQYKGLAQAGDVAPPQPPIPDAGNALRSALTDIRTFSQEHELSPWTGWFRQALDALDAEAPEPPYHPDMLPSVYPAEARRLLAAAAQSWVFGGMGSWNDLGFERGEADGRYHELSRRLYAAMLTAFVAGVNVDL